MSDVINLLPDSIANRIAAGEVVDRPAGAVKELLENAIDAGATRIQLTLRDAGRTLIQVVDNGCGMSDTDARLCFERHATSKIRTSDDLFAIHTMGFRGEALPSIAAIAQVELKTRQHDAELGTRVVIEGSSVKQQEPCACQPGTTISVKNLFFNVPARRNFLKKDSIEFSHIEEMFKRVAIINHDIAFTLTNGDKLLYDLKAENLAQRVAAIFGTGYSQKLYPIEESTNVVSLKGYVSKPETARRTRGEQYIFINKRYIRNNALSAAIEKAYTDLIPDRTYPSYFVNLEVPPDRIDINIHPTKTEVKLIDDQVIFSILRAATRKAIGQFALATELEFSSVEGLDFTPPPSGYTPPDPTIKLNPDYNPFHAERHTTGGGAPHSAAGVATHNTNPLLRNFFDTAKPAGTQITIPSSANDTDDDTDTPDTPDSQVTPFQLGGTYIVSSIKSGLLLIHQQRAHERILFERYMTPPEQIASQQLLFPIECTFSPADSELLGELLPLLKAQGFEIVPSDGKVHSYCITAAPPQLTADSIEPLIESVIADSKGAMLQKFNDKSRSLNLSLARHTAIKAGQPLSVDDMQRIIADLFACQLPRLSPSGEPTLVVMTHEELRQKFNIK
ncbi:MAG: DNA mismatch repair endonuclease MutL [Bacteroidales bacterium]|nr:DNA mismatch repair endonuclease MutL [Bacteroidales bacterium]